MMKNVVDDKRMHPVILCSYIPIPVPRQCKSKVFKCAFIVRYFDFFCYNKCNEMGSPKMFGRCGIKKMADTLVEVPGMVR